MRFLITSMLMLLASAAYSAFTPSPLISRAQLIPLSNYVAATDLRLTVASNYLYSLIGAKGDVTTAQLNFASNYLWSVSGMGGGTGVTLAELLNASNVLRIASATVGTNTTNHANAISVALSNLSYAIGANGTNYSLAGATALTNLINTRSVNLSNYVDSRSVNASNLSYAIGANSTNFTRSTGADLTNLVYIVGLNTTNYASTLFQIASARFTNYITTMNGRGTNTFLTDSTNKVQNASIAMLDVDGNPIALFGAPFGDLYTKFQLPQLDQDTILFVDSANAVESLTIGSGLVLDTNFPPTLSSVVSSFTNIFDTVLTTNGWFRLQTNLSTSVTQQVDYANGPSAYYLTKIATNRVFQFTNVWVAGVSNRVIDFFLGGSDNAIDYTVTFLCPNPAGVVFQWGVNSVTNGPTTVTVTNGMALGVSITGWQSNTFEGYFSHVQ